MSLVAKLKEQYSKGGGVTPQQYNILQKTAAEKEAEAIRIAKARAARYNITLRSTQLQEAKVATNEPKKPSYDPSKVVKGTTNEDYKKKVTAASNEAPKAYNLKKVGLPDKLGEALHHNRDPSLAKAVVENAGKQTEVAVPVEEPKAIEEAPKEETVVLRSESVSVEVHEDVAAVLAEAKVEVTPEVVQTLQHEDSPSVVGAEFEMTTLKEAVESNNPDAINQAVVTEFIEAHAPELLPEVPQLMEEYKGNEQELMEKLAEEHPDPAQAIEEKHTEAADEAPKTTETVEITGETAIDAAVIEHGVQKDEELKEHLEESSANAEEFAAQKERKQSTFIFSAVNENGEWQVNPEDTPAAEEAAT